MSVSPLTHHPAPGRPGDPADYGDMWDVVPMPPVRRGWPSCWVHRLRWTAHRWIAGRPWCRARARLQPVGSSPQFCPTMHVGAQIDIDVAILGTVEAADRLGESPSGSKRSGMEADTCTTAHNPPSVVADGIVELLRRQKARHSSSFAALTGSVPRRRQDQVVEWSPPKGGHGARPHRIDSRQAVPEVVPHRSPRGMSSRVSPWRSGPRRSPTWLSCESSG